MIRCTPDMVARLRELLRPYGLQVHEVADGREILGSYWGESEAGLVADGLYVRADTPLHSALHEACHYICMDDRRRQQLHTDAGGDYMEENGVCYLQILLAEHIPGVGGEVLQQDMDQWGYSFRLGSARRWFREDAEDALAWLRTSGLVDPDRNPTWKLRY